MAGIWIGENKPRSRWPKLIFVVTSKAPVVRKAVLHRAAGNIGEVTSAADIVRVGDESASHQKFAVKRKFVISKKPVAWPNQIVILRQAFRLVKAQPAPFSLDAELIYKEFIQIGECSHALQTGRSPVWP